MLLNKTAQLVEPTTSPSEFSEDPTKDRESEFKRTPKHWRKRSSTVLSIKEMN